MSIKICAFSSYFSFSIRFLPSLGEECEVKLLQSFAKFLIIEEIIWGDLE